MALSLNTSHPLYADLIGLFCVDEDNTIKDLTGNNTCTPHANVVVGSGTYGRHFRTFVVSNNAQGVALSPGVPPKPMASPVCSIFVAVNAANSRASRGIVFEPSSQSISPAVYTGDVVGIQSGTGNPTLLGTTDLIGTGAHSFGAAWNGVTGQLGHKVFADGSVENSSSSNFGNASDVTFLSYIGGSSTNGYGGLAADYVWVAVFRRYLSDAEIEALHTSLGANNAFGLVQAASDAAPTFPGPNIGNQTGTVGTALTANNVASKFSDTDALTFSAIGSWPPGVTVSSAGVISGTPTTAGTYSGLSVRATDTAAQTVDSDTFSFTIGAAANLITVANSQQANTASSAAILQTGAGTITLPALKDWGTGNVKSGETGVTLIINNATSGALVNLLTGQTTNASGVLPTLTGLVSGTAYRITTILADGSEGTWKYTAA